MYRGISVKCSSLIKMLVCKTNQICNLSEPSCLDLSVIFWIYSKVWIETHPEDVD